MAKKSRKPTKPSEADVRAAEAAAQRSVCDIPAGDLPDALSEALARRVEVNLDRATDATVRRVGGTDAQVRKLESPYRRGRTREAPTKPATKAANKTTATKAASKAADPAAVTTKKETD